MENCEVQGNANVSGAVHPITKPTEGENNDPGYYSEQTANEPLPTWWLWFELATMLAFTVATAVLYLYLAIPTGYVLMALAGMVPLVLSGVFLCGSVINVMRRLQGK